MGDQQQPDLFSINASENEAREQPMDARGGRGRLPSARPADGLVQRADRDVPQPGDRAAGQQGRPVVDRPGGGRHQSVADGPSRPRPRSSDHGRPARDSAGERPGGGRAAGAVRADSDAGRGSTGAGQQDPARGELEDRWRDVRYRTEPSEAVEDLVDTVWPQRSAMFRVKAAYLLATRAEEGRPVPTSPRHHLVPRLTPQVEEELRADGYPVE